MIAAACVEFVAARGHRFRDGALPPSVSRHGERMEANRHALFCVWRPVAASGFCQSTARSWCAARRCVRGAGVRDDGQRRAVRLADISFKRLKASSARCRCRTACAQRFYAPQVAGCPRSPLRAGSGAGGAAGPHAAQQLGRSGGKG